MTVDDKTTRSASADESPFELLPIEGIPFGKDSEEARAIERILAWGEPEQPRARSRPARLAAWLTRRLGRAEPRRA